MRIQILFILQLLLLILAIIYKNQKPPKHNKSVKNLRQNDMVSYSRDVVPVLDHYCYSCHSSVNASAALDFTNYDHVYIAVLSHTLMDTDRTFPSCAAFYDSDSIRTDSNACLKIQRWIKQGALYN